MPFPETSGVTREIRGSVFSALAGRIATYPGEVYPLHVGDTWIEPLVGTRMEDLTVERWPDLHRYSEPRGRSELLERLAARIGQNAGIAIQPEQVFVTAGATAGLFASLLTLLHPGDDVLILAPYWPLIEGMIRACRAQPIAVPTHDLASPEDLTERLDELASPNTSAIYFSTPNNPSGRVLDRHQVEAIADWAARRDLWIVADEVYEDYVYQGEHTPAIGLQPERTIVAFSFSKAYGMAGNRIGYVAGPRATLDEIRKVGTHTFYSAPTAGQIGAAAMLDHGGAWLEQARRSYREVGSRVADLLETAAPEGGTFLFVEIENRLDDRGLLGFLEDCADRGVFLAPGPSFGPYPNWVRICFSAAPPEVTLRGARVLAELLGKAPRNPPESGTAIAGSSRRALP